MQIKITYTSGHGMLSGLDAKIRAAMELIGCKWYAQGIDCTTEERDICFDYSLEEWGCKQP